MMNRVLRVVLLLLWLELGLALILVPWSEVWDMNYFLYQYPALAFLSARRNHGAGSDERTFCARSVSPPDYDR
jgi:hypothetical protein